MKHKPRMAESIRNHPMFRSKPPEDLSDESLFATLVRIVDVELDKPPEESDIALMEQCADLMAELLPADTAVSDRDRQDSLARIKKRAAIHTDSGEGQHGMVRKRIILAAAILTLALSMSLSIVAHRQGYGHISDMVLRPIKHMKPGDQTSIGNMDITVTKMPTTYKTIEDFFQKTGMDLLFPSVLPAGVEVNRVVLYMENAAFDHVSYVLSDTRYTITVTGPKHDFSLWENAEIYHANERDHFVVAVPGAYQAACSYGDFEYIVQAPTHEDLICIIEYLREPGSDTGTHEAYGTDLP